MQLKVEFEALFIAIDGGLWDEMEWIVEG